jgi:hypothetical protein
MSEGVVVLDAVLIVNFLMGVAFAFNLAGASDWVARSYATIPRFLRLPGQDNAQLYRFVGALQIAISCVGLMWVAVRVR